MCGDGSVDSDEAVRALLAASYTGAVQMQGGYAAWTQASTAQREAEDPFPLHVNS